VDWLVFLDSTRTGETRQGRIRLVRYESQKESSSEMPVREYPIPGGLPSGRWRLDHRYGLLVIGLPDDRPSIANKPGESHEAPRCAYTHVNNVGMVGLSISARGCSLELRELTIQSVQPVGKLTANQQELLGEARQLDVRVQQHWQSGEFVEALELAKRSLDIRERVMGKYFRSYINGMNSVAVFHQSLGDYASAEQLYEHMLELTEAVIGDQHPDYAIGLGNLAEVYHALGKFQRAESLHRRALRIFAEAVGTETPPYDNMLHNLSVLYLGLGDLARAEPLCQQVLHLREKVRGKRHPSFAISMETLGMIQHEMGDTASAAKLYEASLEIIAAALGKQHPDYAVTLYNLANACEEMGQHARAEALIKESLEIIERVYTRQSLRYADGVKGLASLYHLMGRYADAEPLYQQASAIIETVLGRESTEYAGYLEGQSWLALAKDELDRAESFAAQALEIRVRLLGKHHRQYVSSLGNLASVYYHKRDFARAEPLAAEALGILRAHLDEAVVIQSQRQQHLHQFESARQLYQYLSIAASANQFARSAWEQHLNWKGAVFVRQHEYQQIMRDTELEGLWRSLQETTGQLSTLALHQPRVTPTGAKLEEQGSSRRKREQWSTDLLTLAARKESLEKELSQNSDAFRRARRFVAADQMQAALPDGTALIDFAEYWAFEDPVKGRNSEPQYLAFVARKNSDVAMIDLGPAKGIADSIKAWREPFYSGYDASSGDQAALEAAQVLRQRVWEPLEPLVNGAETVLISPAGALGELPFAALPGRRPGTFLLEDYRLANVIVPSLLPAMLEQSRPSDRDRSLLLVGNIDYAAPISADNPRGDVEPDPRTALVAARGTIGEWLALPHAAEEIGLIESVFLAQFGSAAVTRLAEREATEESLCQLAPQHANVHIVTHGFFADRRYRSSEMAMRDATVGNDRTPFELLGRDPRIRAWQPGLLSGLVLAGANRPPAVQGQDGILTAEEVAYLPLANVDMVVLSACETDLSVVQEGERIAGLQRAFQVAGAACTVTSLWKVDDQATSQLMARFYQNHWEHRMSKLDALREAQLWMLNHVPASGQRQRRGTIARVNLAEKPPSKPASERTSPYYWGAFVLSGDWR
jgi:CHAT domain-containing protein